jgi:very-short-patch-repair endonuclease
VRHSPTASEAALWSALRGSARGVTPRRQVPVGGNFIGDFVASEVKLIVEIDGNWHARRSTADARHDRMLRRLGFTVLHFSNRQVEQQLAVVLLQVGKAIGTRRGAP